MKTLGIIGGIGPESTIDYYRLLLAAFRERTRDGSAPAIFINSIDMDRMLGMVAAGEVEKMTQYLVAEVLKLARAGADFALMAANTPHIAFAEISRQSPIPMISIVEAACQAAKARSLKRPGLFGTRFTMQGNFFPEVFSREGIELVVPNDQEQSYIHGKYMNELGKGVFLPETRAGLLEIADRLKKQNGIDGLILAGTELPLILRDATQPGIPVLDTTKIHVQAAVTRLLE